MSEQPRRRRRVPSENLEPASILQQKVESQPQKLAVSVKKPSLGQVRESWQQKKTAFPVVFLVLIVVYLVLNMIDGAPMWDTLILYSNWYNQKPHAFLTLGAGPSKTSLRWGSIPAGIGSAFPGVLFAVFPFLTIVFANKGWKIPSCVMSVFNLLIAMLCCASAFRYWWVMGICWLLYLAASVILLLNAIGIVKDRKKFASLFFLMGVVSVVLFVVLSFFQVSILPGRTKYIGFSGLTRAFTNYNWTYYVRGFCIGSYLNPLSRACMYCAFGVSLLCPAKSRKKESVVRRHDDRSDVIQSGAKRNSKYPLLEQYKQEHRM